MRIESKGFASLYFILGYAGAVGALVESEQIYIRFFAMAYACLITYQLIQTYENNNNSNDDDTNEVGNAY